MNLTPDIAPEIDNDSFDMEDAEDVIGLAKSLVDGRHLGILTTVNEKGKPEVRWMSTLAFDRFPVFHTLTAADSRKVRQIAANPAVNWMFFNHDLSLILNLTGTARILTDRRTLKHIWKEAKDKSHAYFLKAYEKTPYVAIETTIDSIECNSPKNGLRFLVTPHELAYPGQRA